MFTRQRRVGFAVQLCGRLLQGATTLIKLASVRRQAPLQKRHIVREGGKFLLLNESKEIANCSGFIWGWFKGFTLRSVASVGLVAIITYQVEKPSEE